MSVFALMFYKSGTDTEPALRLVSVKGAPACAGWLEGTERPAVDTVSSNYNIW